MLTMLAESTAAFLAPTCCCNPAGGVCILQLLTSGQAAQLSRAKLLLVKTQYSMSAALVSTNWPSHSGIGECCVYELNTHCITLYRSAASAGPRAAQPQQQAGWKNTVRSWGVGKNVAGQLDRQCLPNTQHSRYKRRGICLPATPERQSCRPKALGCQSRRPNDGDPPCLRPARLIQCCDANSMHNLRVEGLGDLPA